MFSMFSIGWGLAATLVLALAFYFGRVVQQSNERFHELRDGLAELAKEIKQRGFLMHWSEITDPVMLRQYLALYVEYNAVYTAMRIEQDLGFGDFLENMVSPAHDILMQDLRVHLRQSIKNMPTANMIKIMEKTNVYDKVQRTLMGAR